MFLRNISLGPADGLVFKFPRSASAAQGFAVLDRSLDLFITGMYFGDEKPSSGARVPGFKFWLQHMLTAHP